MAMLTRWEPMRDFVALSRAVNRMIDEEPFTPLFRETQDLSTWAPAVDVYEDAESVRLTAELPGLEHKDVDVRIENGVLTLTGERKLEDEEKKDNYYRIERRYGAFTRSFTLPTTVDADKVKAEFKNGLLKITLPKREEAKPKQIKVKVEA